MCDKNCRDLHKQYQELLLQQIKILSNEVKVWRSISSQSSRMSVEEFMRSTDLCGWQYSLQRGPLGFPNFIKRFWDKLFDLFKLQCIINIMPNSPTRKVFMKHRKRKRNATRDRQLAIAENAKKKTREALERLGRLPSIAKNY